MSVHKRKDVTILDISGGEMIRAVSSVHLEAFAGYFNARLGSGYATSLIKWFSHEKRAIAIAAVDSHRKVIGYAIGAPVGHDRALKRELFWVSARSLILRPWLLCDGRFWAIGKTRLRNLVGPREVSRSLDLPEPTMSLVAIGVASSGQRKGIGLQLVQAFDERARALKMRALLLWVDEDRAGTRHFYERCGFRPCADSVDGSMFYCRLFVQDKEPSQHMTIDQQAIAL